jgi:hypothetical protein
MYTLLRHFGRETLINEIPGLGLALLIAELFFKFGSFTLECLCFLAAWSGISFGIARLRRRHVQPARGG